MKKTLLFLLFVLLSISSGVDGAPPDRDSPPTVSLLTATSVTENSAVLNGNVSPNRRSTRYWFEYGLDSSLASWDNTAVKSAGGGPGSRSVDVPVSGLAAGTVYYYRICASNSLGTTKSDIASFTTSSPPSPRLPPVVSTLTATSVSATGATLNGNVTPNGLATTAWFEWGTDPALASYDNTSPQPAGSGTTSQSISANVTALANGTTYYYRIAATNGYGTSRGTIVGFTLSLPPSATTLAATEVTTSGATLNGTVSTSGLATTVWFQWGTDPTLSVCDNTVPQPVGPGVTVQPVSAVLGGLSNESSYFFRIVASTDLGTTRGDTLAFATSGCLGCHGSLDGSRPGVNGAPVVTKYWQTSGHGKSGIALQCEDCHDTGSPAGQHATSGTGTFNTLNWPAKESDTTNANTAHLKSFFFPSFLSPTGADYAGTFDNACGNRVGCHVSASGGRNAKNMRHAQDELMEFGTHGTVANPKIYTWYTPVDNVLDFYKSRSPWVIRDAVNTLGASPQYGTCVSCHDPHGTGTTDTVAPGDPRNVMVRGQFRTDVSNFFCAGACHR